MTYHIHNSVIVDEDFITYCLFTHPTADQVQWILQIWGAAGRGRACWFRSFQCCQRQDVWERPVQTNLGRALQSHWLLWCRHTGHSFTQVTPCQTSPARLLAKLPKDMTVKFFWMNSMGISAQDLQARLIAKQLNSCMHICKRVAWSDIGFLS